MLKLKNSKKIKQKAQSKKFNSTSEVSELKTGDLIEIVAPGSSTAPEILFEGTKELKNWGYRISYETNMIEPQIFLSNSDQKRFTFLKNAIKNSQSKAIWCLRGGYGSIRLLPFLAKMKKPKNKKLLIGLSDITSLHIFLNQKWNWPSLHGPLLDRLAQKKLSIENITEVREALENPNYIGIFEGLVPLNSAAKKNNKIKSKVIGGNLMVVVSTLGTDYQIDAKNKIIFLEELNERAYRVDRCLEQLKQAGVFKNAGAVVFGDFTDCHEPNKENYIQQVFIDFFKDMSIPVFSGIESGHGEKQRPLFFNTEAHLTCGKKPRMLVYSPFKKATKKRD